ncbi:MAG: site-2 protease family protein [Gammaproteobacteria bacterium]
MEQLTIVQTIAVWVLPVLFAVTMHEVAHGFAAYLLGDKTAFIQGRLSLNPAKHIDPVGTIVVPALLMLVSGGRFVFGWAKPVPVITRYFKKPRRDMILVAIAGPLANFLMMFIWAAIAKLGIFLKLTGLDWALAVVYMGSAGIMINALLMVFNLLPLPPLDGGHILMGLLPARAAEMLRRIEPYGFFILLILIATRLLTVITMPALVFLQWLVSICLGLH